MKNAISAEQANTISNLKRGEAFEIKYNAHLEAIFDCIEKASNEGEFRIEHKVESFTGNDPQNTTLCGKIVKTLRGLGFHAHDNLVEFGTKHIISISWMDHLIKEKNNDKH